MERPAADATDPHPLPTPYRGGPLPITADAVGPLRWDAPRSAETLQALFPDSVVRDVAGPDGAPIRTVERKGQLLLEVYDGLVGSVRTMAPEAVGPNREHIGEPWGRLNLKSADCRIGRAGRDLLLTCPAPGARGVDLVVALPDWPSNTMPPDAELNERAVLHAFVWRYSQNLPLPPAPELAR